MIGATLGEVFLRAVPDHLKAGVTDGSLRVFGSVLRSATNGQIAGFMQETSFLQNLLPSMMSAGSGLQLAAVPGQVGQLVQGEIILAGVQRIEHGMRLLTQLGVADLAMNAAGIGISAIGFSVMSMKIDQVKRVVESISGDIVAVSAKLDELQRDAIDADFAELRSLSKAFDEGWRLSGDAAVRRWHEVARGALSGQTRFEQRAARVLVGGPSHYLAADPFLDAVSLANALRVAALAACNETSAAQEAAIDGARSFERMTGPIGMADLSLAELTKRKPEAGTTRWALAQAEANVAARITAGKIRRREAASATRAAPLALLEQRAIPARDWLAAAREEIESPVIILLAEGSQK